ncbi:unnamed protein product [Schistosoma bovis]|nr:unnamed protein product [Schistosoma bovis]CAH8655167.1 unnamed protein product [Schistosoma bovis]
MPMSIFVKTLTGLSFELHVSPTETITSVKSKIQRTEGIPINQQHLVWQNCELDNHRRLRDYSISEGSTLCLVLSLRSGPLIEHRTPPLRLAANHPSKTTVPPFTSVSSSTCGSSFVYSNLLTPVIKPSILQSQNTENGGRSDLTLDKSKQTGAEWYEIDEANTDSVLPSDSALESQPDLSVDVRPESSSISSSVAQKAMDVSFTDAFQNFVNSDTPLSSGLREQNSNNIGQSPSNLEVVVGISPLNGNITETTYISERNRSLSSPEKETLNALTEQPSVPIAVAVNNHSNVPESSNSSPFSPSVHYSESSSALNQQNHPSIWVSCDTHIPPPFHKQDRESKTSTASDFGEYKLNIKRMYKENQVNGVGHLDNCSNTETTNSTSANILASLLAKVIPNRTSFRCCDGPRCPHQSHRGFSPLLEENSEWFDKELDSVASINFETDTDQDDDSPPLVTTGYQSYSFCNCGFNHSHSISCEALETAISSIVQAEVFVRLQECDELAEKVERLKTQMKSVRLRKQNWYQNTQNTKYSMCKEETSAEDQYHDIANWGKNSEHVNEIAANSCDFPWTNSQINRNHLSNLHTSSLNCLKDESDFPKSPQTDTRGRIRQRRYATITPPDVNCLIRTADSQCRGSESTTNILPSLFYPGCTSQSSEGSMFENSLSLRSHQHKNQFLSPDKNLTTPVTTLSYNGPTLCSDSVSQTRQHSMNSLQVSKLTRLGSSSRFSSNSNRSTPTKTSSSVPFLPKLGSSVSTGHLATTIPPRLPSRGGSRLNTPVHFSKPNDCDEKLLNPTPPHYISTVLIEASHLPSSLNSIRRKRCSMCSRKIGITNSYTCRCDRSFCSVHRYAEVHACQYDYKAEARRYIIESNPVITTPKLPKI